MILDRILAALSDDRRLTRIALVFAAALAFYQYGLRDITYFDEPRYAGIAREMAEARSYAIPLLYGETYTEKPPLWFWLAMLAGKLFGFNSWAYFFPNVVAHFLSTLLVFDLGRRMLSRGAGPIAALAFAACPLALHYARSAQLDPLLAFGVTLTAWGGLRAAMGGGFAYGALGAIGFAVASLVKGHIGLFGLIAPLTWITIHRSWRGVSPLRVIGYVALALAPFATWFAFVVREIGADSALALYFRRQVVERTSGTDHFSPWPIGPEYLAALALMAPLTFFLWRVLTDRTATVGVRVLRFSALAIFAIFAVVPSKRELYLMPLVPYVALLVADQLARLRDGVLEPSRFERAVTVAMSVLLGVGSIVAAIGATRITGGLASLGIDGVLLAAGGMFGAWLVIAAWRRPSGAAPLLMVMHLAVVSLFAEPVLARAANARFGWPAFGETAQATIPEDATVFVYAFTKAHAPQYFTRRKFEFVSEMSDLIDRLHPLEENYVITREKGAKELKRVEGLVVKKITDDGREFDDRTMLYAVTIAGG